MPKILTMDQRSDEWHAQRARRIGASDAAVVLGISPFRTPYQLWLEKTGRNAKPEEEKVKGKSFNWAIERGVKWEGPARARYELLNDIDMSEAVLLHDELDWMMASLDGYNAEHKRILEIKVPGKETFEKAKKGIVVEHYAAQLEHQMLVAQADDAHFFCVKVESKNGREQITDDALVVYKSNPDLRERLIPKLHEFMGYLKRNEPPPLTDKDVFRVEEYELLEKMDELRLAVVRAQAAQGEVERFTAEIARRTPHRRIQGAGLLIEKRFNQTRGEYMDIKFINKKGA